MVNRYNQIPAQVGNSEEVMAIAITDEYMNGECTDAQVCKADAPATTRDVVSTPRAAADVPFHRHCQKTVCSAHGYNRQGATWETLSPGTQNDLPNLNLGLQSGETWISKFEQNGNNITEDLRTILELIDATAALIAKSWYLTFKDNHNNQIAKKEIHPWTNSSNEYVFANFGRDITLTIDDDKTFKFNTIRQMSGENLSISLPKSDLTVNFNGVEAGVAEDIYMPNSATININQDFNKVFTGGYGNESSTSITADVNGNRHIYRHYSNQATLTIGFNIDSKYDVGGSASSPIVEWEIHVKNRRTDTTNLQLTPSVLVGGVSGRLTTKALTDQLYVEPGKTNVYVFRADMYAMVLTYSLAYVY